VPGDVEAVLRQRVATQHLLTDPLPSAAAVVADLLCVQSQEWAHAFWSLGMRSQHRTLARVREEFDRGNFLRTHILRPTWHFVAAADIAAVLAVTSPRVQQRNAGRYRALDLDAPTLTKAADLITALLAGGNFRTRSQIGEHLAQHDIPAPGQRLAYLVMNAELEGLICSGPMAGAQHTYALLEERAPRLPVERPWALAELVFRFFSGHGPATSADLVRWSSLPADQVRAGLHANRDRLEARTVGDQTVWWDPRRRLSPLGSSPRVLLLPIYDEVVLSYPAINFPAAPDHPARRGTDRFVGSVVVDEVDVGTWRRTVRGRKVQVETALTPRLGRRDREAVRLAVEELAGFLELELEVVESRPEDPR
jgi:hypothetical protein